MARHIPRVYCPQLEGELFHLPAFQIGHLLTVLRLRVGENFLAFNEADGEWLCSIEDTGKTGVVARKITLKRKAQRKSPLALAFCPIKPNNTRLVIEKGTELGVSDFYPVISEFTNQKFNAEKMELVAISAAEQSERLDIPTIHGTLPLGDFVANLPTGFTWLSAIEREENTEYFDKIGDDSLGFIIGAEGGFSEEEKTMLKQYTTAVHISDNILRAETAAIACLALANARRK